MLGAEVVDFALRVRKACGQLGCGRHPSRAVICSKSPEITYHLILKLMETVLSCLEYVVVGVVGVLW